MPWRPYLLVLASASLAALLAFSLFTQADQWRGVPRFVPVLSILPPYGWCVIFAAAALALVLSYAWPVLAVPTLAALTGCYGAWLGGYLTLYFTLPDQPVASTAIFLAYTTFLHVALTCQKYRRGLPLAVT